jgi:hypothetical protein
MAGDVPLIGDVDGDRLGDLIVWSSTTGVWRWLTSSSGYDDGAAGSRRWGAGELGDMPFVGDFDGDGRSDLAVWRAATGTWYWLSSSMGYNPAAAVARQWGSSR